MSLNGIIYHGVDGRGCGTLNEEALLRAPDKKVRPQASSPERTERETVANESVPRYIYRK